MESLLNRAYFRRHCHECGHSYTLTLYGILQEQRIAGEWHNLQGRDIDDADTHFVMGAIPGTALEAIETAWLEIVDAAEKAGVELLLTPAETDGGPHHHH